MPLRTLRFGFANAPVGAVFPAIGLVVVLVATLVAPLMVLAAASTGFAAAASMLAKRGDRGEFTLTRLCDGRLLATGGNGASTLASAEIYSPATGAWASTGSMASPRAGHSATLLPDCTVLIAGGVNGPSVVASAEVYDPVAGTFSPGGSMTLGRSGHSAFSLPGGKVLVAAGSVPGGGDSFGTASAEIYDVSTRSWAPTGALATARMNQAAVQLPDGRVLVAGGQPQGVTFANLASAELYDPATGVWSAAGSMAIGRRAFHSLSALPDGRVLVTGGIVDWTSRATDKAEIFDPVSLSWTPTTSMPSSRHSHSGTALADGRVLLAGGNDHPADFGPGTYLATALLFDPAAQSWTYTSGPLAGPRAQHHALRLLDGRVIIVGGRTDSAVLGSSEVFGTLGTSAAAAGTARLIGTLGLGIDGGVRFGGLLTGGAQEFVSAPQSLAVVDTTAGQTGWNLSIAGTPFTTGGTSPRTLPKTALLINSGAITATTVHGSGGTLPTNGMSGKVVVPLDSPGIPAAAKFYNAQAGTGTGSFYLGVPYLLDVPAGTVDGTYTSTLTLTIATGP